MAGLLGPRKPGKMAIAIAKHTGKSLEGIDAMTSKDRRDAYRQTPEEKAKRAAYNKTPKAKAYKAAYRQTPEGKASNKMTSSKSSASRKSRTPRWIRDNHYQPDNDAMKDTYRTASRTGKAVDHGLPLLGKQVSGLDVPSNLMAMDPKQNIIKGNRLPNDFLDWEWKHDNAIPGSTRKGRLSAYRPAGTFGPVPDVAPNEMVRVPRSQGGHLNPSAFNHPTAKNIGKMGLLGAGEMALNYFWPDNPVAASREKGYDTMQSLGLDLDGAIQGIENTPLQVAARLGQGLLVDPLVTAFGAGNWVGDKINNMFSKD